MNLTLLACIAQQLELARQDDRHAGEALKLAAIALESHVHESTVSRVFQGKDHRLSTLVAIANALNCDIDLQIRKRK